MDYQEDIISFQDFKRIIQSNGSANWIRKLKRSSPFAHFIIKCFRESPPRGHRLAFIYQLTCLMKKEAARYRGHAQKELHVSFVLFTFCVFDS